MPGRSRKSTVSNTFPVSRAGQVEGHALRQTVLAGFGNFQTATLENIDKGHGSRLAADDGDALGGLGFIFVNGLLLSLIHI